jgi:hypothetical protein
MRERGRIAGTAVAVILATTMLGCGSEPNGVGAPATAGTGAVVLIDADAGGAIVVDGRGRTALGVRRDGQVVWRVALDNDAPLPVSCVDACPDALFSGSVASTNEPSVPGPEPVLILAGGRRALPGPAGPDQPGQRRVLSAAGADDLVLSIVDTTGRAWLELHHGRSLDRVAVGGRRTSWSPSADGAHALAVTELAAGQGEARWFDRGRGGWQLAAGPASVTGHASCVAPTGDRAIVLGQAPAVVDRAGLRRDVTDLDTVGTCAFAGTGAILAALSQRPSGPEARVRVIDAAGRVTWASDLPHDVRVGADPTGARVAYVAAGKLHEFDTRTGAPTRTVPDVRSARYDGAGELVVLRPDLRVAWLA